MVLITTAIVVLVVLIAFGLGYMVWASSGGEGTVYESLLTEEELIQVRRDIYKIEQGVELELSKQEHRQAGARTKEAIAEALKDQR